MEDAGSDHSHWHLFGRRHPKSEIVFFFQVVLIYIVVITAIVNLSLNTDNSKLWTALLSSSIGYLLPAPSLKENKK
jgi:Trk-type K+ transport system membrane component